MEDVLARLALVAAVLAAVAVVGWWWRRRDGRLRTADTDDQAAPAFDQQQLDEVGLTIDGGAAGALLLSSPTCASCVQVQRILTEVVDQRPDFTWVSVDAGEHLDLARQHHVLRVPTLFVIDAQGHLLARTSGIPARHEVEQLIDEAAGERAH